MPRAEFWPWIVTGAVAQILATALMLAAMNDRSFVVTIAYTKTEPVQTAIFGLVLLGDRLTPALAVAILIAGALCARGFTGDPDGLAHALPLAARPGGARRDLPRLEAFDVCGPHGRDR